jgi:isopenicillin N synthase-like dioxygenase
MRVTKGFFNLPLEEKQKYSNLVNGREFNFEGYGNDMVASEDQILDWCDRLYLAVEPESRVVSSLWPAQPPAFRDALREYTARCRSIAGAVLAVLARVLGLHEGRFTGMLGEGVGMTHARFNYYPRCPRPDLVVGLKPHSDASVITVVLVDDAVSGLQVQKPDDGGAGVWYDVPIVPNALLVMVGDATEVSYTRVATIKFVLARSIMGGSEFDLADNEQWVLQEPGAQGGDERGARPGVAGDVLLAGPG